MKRLSLTLCICLCSPASVVSSVTRDMESKVDYVAALNELVKQGRDESLNAAPFYTKAAELCVELPKEIDHRELLQWPAELPKSHLPLLKQWIQSNGDAIAQLTLGTQKPYYWNQYQVKSVWEADTVAYLPPLKFVTYATLFQGKLSTMEHGTAKEAAENFLVCVRFGLHLTQAPTVTEQLVGLWIVDEAVQGVFLCLAKTDYDGRVVDPLQRGVREQFSKIQNQAFSLEAEKLQHLEVVQMLFQGTEDDSKLKPGEELGLAARFGDLTREDLETVRRGRTVRDIEAAFAYCKEFLAMSPRQAKEKVPTFWEGLRKQTSGNPVVRFCMFNVPNVARVRAHRSANRSALLTTLAVLRYKHDRGRLPDDLRELLSADYVSQLPMDPYSDGSLVYRQTKADFTVYSLSEDFDDDGGAHSKWGWDDRDGDYVFWPVQSASAEKDD